jgi:hypothetical protein
MQNAAIKYKKYNSEKFLKEGFNYPIGVIGEECSDIWNAFINHIVNGDFERYSGFPWNSDKETREILKKISNFRAICFLRKKDLDKFFGGQIEWDDLIWVFEALLNAEYAYPPENPIEVSILENECIVVALKNISNA